MSTTDPTAKGAAWIPIAAWAITCIGVAIIALGADLHDPVSMIGGAFVIGYADFLRGALR